MHKSDSAPQARCFVLGSASILPVTGLIAGDAEYCVEIAKCVRTAYALPPLLLPQPGELRLLKADSFFGPQARRPLASARRRLQRAGERRRGGPHLLGSSLDHRATAGTTSSAPRTVMPPPASRRWWRSQ